MQQRLERGKQATASGVYKLISQSIKQRLEKEAGTTLSMERKHAKIQRFPATQPAQGSGEHAKSKKKLDAQFHPIRMKQ